MTESSTRTRGRHGAGLRWERRRTSRSSRSCADRGALIREKKERVAAKYLADLYAGAARLGACSNLLQEHPDTSLRLRFYRVREHVLICDVIGDRIFVLALRHAVMDLPSRIAELEPQLIHEAEIMTRQIDRAR